jgi:hypothetical protein
VAADLVSTLAPWLVAASAAIVLALGGLHLLYTFRGSLLHPRDPELQSRMQAVSPGITRQTTMWNCWVGFNATHSWGLMLFGAVYGYLALAQADLLFRSAFLLGLGVATLLGYAVVARRYFFRTPFRGIVAASVLFGLALVARWA